MDKKRIAIAFLIVLTNTVGATAILPLLPLYVEKQFGASPVQATLVIALFYAAQFLAAPLLGKLSDRFGRRPVLIASQIGTIISYLMFIFALQLGGSLGNAGLALGISGGLLIIYLAQLVDGLTGGNVSVAEAYASDISDDKSRAQALGLVGGAVGLGHILGPVLAVILSGISLLAPMIGAAVISGITLLLTIVLLGETQTPEKRGSNQARASAQTTRMVWQRPVVLVLAAAFVVGVYISAVVSSFSLFSEHVLFINDPPEVIIQKTGLMITIMGIVAAIAQIGLIGPLVKRLGEQALVVIGSLLLVASALTIGSARTTPPLALGIVFYGLGYGLVWPNLQAIMTRFGGKEDAGRLLGIFQSAFSLALIVAPIGAGFLMQNIGAFAIYHLGTLLTIVATILGVFIFHLPLGERTADPVSSEPRSLAQRFHH